MQEQEMHNEPTLYFACADCGDRVRVSRAGLPAVLRRHREEHPDHGERPFSASIGYIEFAEP